MARRHHRKRKGATSPDRLAHVRPGAPPGIDHHPGLQEVPGAEEVRIRCIEFGPSRVEHRMLNPSDLDAQLAVRLPPWAEVRWIDVDGLDAYVINRFRLAYGFHGLTAEDVLNVPQRGKVETHDDHLFIVSRMLRRVDRILLSEQVSFFVYEQTILTFQESPGDVWDPVRERIEKDSSRLRTGKTSYLFYALLDALVDQCFPILEEYGDELEDLESDLTLQPGEQELRRLHGIKSQLVRLRRSIWPMREVADALYRGEHVGIDDNTRTYLRDVHDHTLRVIDILESYREMAGGLTDLYLSSVSNRMNEVMKVLTILASLFIPITFLAGVYGMNFEHIPELGWRYAYPGFWILCAISVVSLLVFFRRKRWI